MSGAERVLVARAPVTTQHLVTSLADYVCAIIYCTGFELPNVT